MFTIKSAAELATLSPSEQVAYYKEQNSMLQTALTKKNQHKVSAKLAPKGGVSVYGLGRYPITLYRSQWIALFEQGQPLVKELFEQNKAHFDEVEANKGFNAEAAAASK